MKIHTYCMTFVCINNHICGDIVKTEGFIITTWEEFSHGEEIHSMDSSEWGYRRMNTRNEVALDGALSWSLRQRVWCYPFHHLQWVTFHHDGNYLWIMRNYKEYQNKQYLKIVKNFSLFDESHQRKEPHYNELKQNGILCSRRSSIMIWSNWWKA